MSSSTHGRHAKHLAEIERLAPTGKATVLAIRDGGLWSAPSTWSTGSVPRTGDRVYIPSGRTITYDCTKAIWLQWLRVDGGLLFQQDKQTTLKLDTLLSIGTIRAGSKDAPLQRTAGVLICFTDNPIPRESDPEQLGKGWLAYGPVRIYGAPKQPYLEHYGGLAAGSNRIEIPNGIPEGWKVGDRIVLTNTNPLRDESEVRQIRRIDPSAILLNSPLEFAHDTGNERFPIHIANLSRNITFTCEGAERELTEVGHRGHVMFHSADVDIRYAEFYGLGRTKKFELLDDTTFDKGGNVKNYGVNPRGRYPVHFHLIGLEKKILTAYIEGLSVHHAPSWGIVQHSSKLTTVACTTYWVAGAGFMAEISDEIGSLGRGGRYDACCLFISTLGAPLGQRGSEGDTNNPRVKVGDYGKEGWGLWPAPLVNVSGAIVAGGGITYPFSDVRIPKQPPKRGSGFDRSTHGQSGVWIGARTKHPPHRNKAGWAKISADLIPEDYKPHVPIRTNRRGKRFVDPRALPWKIDDVYVYGCRSAGEIWGVRSPFFGPSNWGDRGESMWTTISNLRAIKLSHSRQGLFRTNYSSQIQFRDFDCVDNYPRGNGSRRMFWQNKQSHTFCYTSSPGKRNHLEGFSNAFDTADRGSTYIRNITFIPSERQQKQIPAFTIALVPRKRWIWDTEKQRFVYNSKHFQPQVQISGLEFETNENGATYRVPAGYWENNRHGKFKSFQPSWSHDDFPIVTLEREGQTFRVYADEQHPDKIHQYSRGRGLWAGMTNREIQQRWGAVIGGAVDLDGFDDPQGVFGWLGLPKNEMRNSWYTQSLVKTATGTGYAATLRLQRHLDKDRWGEVKTIREVALTEIWTPVTFMDGDRKVTRWIRKPK